MIDKIQIVSWLLTRRCNMNCSYCKLSTNSYNRNKPSEYPQLQTYYSNEMSTKYVIEGLLRFKLHNPDSFHIFYGGEPFLRNDLFEIIDFCNKNEINYTIISNNSDTIQDKIDEFFNKIEFVKGFTASIDPIVITRSINDAQLFDRYKKSIAGLQRLIKLKDKIQDPVAEITVDNNCIHLLEPLVERLSSEGINSDITFIDIAKNNYYDFSNITDKTLLVQKSKFIKSELDKIIDKKYNVHMADKLLPELYRNLPANIDCQIDKNIHNLTIDSDGSVRLCLRIRGTNTPKLNLLDYLLDDGNLNEKLKENIKEDKNLYCQGCNWSCPLMSLLISKGSSNNNELIHSEKRNNE